MAHIGSRTTRLLPPRGSGLGQFGPPAAPLPAPAPATVPSDPLAARLVGAFATPIVGALSARIAGGGGAGRFQTGGGYYYPYGGGGGTFGFGGISQSTLLIGALALGAVLIFKR